MKYFILLLILSMSQIGQAYQEVRGGGDLCEDRIKIIRDDLRTWILNGGSKGLILPAGVTSDQYAKSMLVQIAQAKVRCVSVGDDGFPVEINNTAKTCIFTKDLSGNPLESQITCDFIRFQTMNESDQTILVHHEYAGLAGVEIPNGDDSNYEISNQISQYEDVLFGTLIVKPVGPGVENNGGKGAAQKDDPRFSYAAVQTAFSQGQVPGSDELPGSWMLIGNTIIPSADHGGPDTGYFPDGQIWLPRMTEAYREILTISDSDVLGNSSWSFSSMTVGASSGKIFQKSPMQTFALTPNSIDIDLSEKSFICGAVKKCRLFQAKDLLLCSFSFRQTKTEGCAKLAPYFGMAFGYVGYKKIPNQL